MSNGDQPARRAEGLEERLFRLLEDGMFMGSILTGRPSAILVGRLADFVRAELAQQAEVVASLREALEREHARVSNMHDNAVRHEERERAAKIVERMHLVSTTADIAAAIRTDAPQEPRDG